MVVGENKRTANIMDGIENTGDVRMHDHRLRLKQRFDIVRKLGQGTYGKVQLGINKKTGQEVAIKTIKKCKIESEADLIRIRREVQIMSSVRHPNIVHIYEVFENSEKMILVMEYCSGGELYDYLSQKKVLQEDEARRLFRQIATAVYYCHIHKICHRDLKLENVLLDDTGSAKIADFGLSNVFKETSLLSTFCGSPLYASPEIVKGTPYIGPEVDCWSLGVLLYTLVYGAMPFDGSNFKRLVRQISNGEYYEPRNPSTASPLIRDMLTVDPLKRADIAYICDNPWVNTGWETSCLEEAEALAAQTPVRLDLLLSLAPAAPSNSNSVVVPNDVRAELGAEESCTDLTSSTSMAIEPSNSAEKRILELVAEGGEDAIKPSPTRTIVSASDNKRKLEIAMSPSGVQRKKERVASCASIAPQTPVPEEGAPELPTSEPPLTPEETIQPNLKSSATITIQPAPIELAKDLTKEIVKEPVAPPKEEEVVEKPAKPRVVIKKKASPTKTLEEKPVDKPEEPKAQEEAKTNAVSAAADKLTSLSIAQPAAPAAQPPAPKPKKLSIPGGNVGNFKDQFERRVSLTSAPEIKRNITKPVVSKIAKPKAQSEDRELSLKSPDNGTVRLQQIGIEPSQTPSEPEPSMRGGVKKTESEPSHSSTSADPSVLLQDARRSLQNSMAKLVEEKAGEESRRRAARDIISSAIRTGKPPMPYSRSSSAGVTSLVSPPGTPPAAPAPPRVFRTEAHHKVEDHRNRGVSVERIIPIQVASEESPTSPPPLPQQPPPKPAPRVSTTPIRRLASTESGTSEACSSPGEPIKKSAREFIIPIAVEGKGYVTPRQRSLEPEPALPHPARHRAGKPRRISSLVSGGESEEEEDAHMHRLRPSRAARAESVSSGEDDEEDEGFHLLTAENLFSTLLHRVRALTQRLNGEEGPGFGQHSLFNNLQSPFFNSPHLPRRNLLREGWGSRDLHADFDSMFKSRQAMPRGSSKKSGKHRTGTQQSSENNESGLDLSDLDLSSIEFSEREMRALSGLTPALSRRLQRQLLAHLPPAAARSLRRTLSLHAPGAAPAPRAARSLSADHPPDAPAPGPAPDPAPDAPHYSTLPRLRRRSESRETTPPATSAAEADSASPARESPGPRGGGRGAERPLLSKYLTPERALSLDESCGSDGGGPGSEAGGAAAAGSLRRHSLRASTAEQPRRRVSRFLRSDFFDAPPDENLYERQRKEREMETQKILREIREKRNKSQEAAAARSPTDIVDAPPAYRDDAAAPKKSLSPIGLLGKERSRSNTPFFPILDNIKETTVDTSLTASATRRYADLENSRQKSIFDENLKESRLIRPKSYPVKTLDSIDEPSESVLPESSLTADVESKERSLPRESKLLRPKSYPTSSPSPEKVYINRTVKKEDTKSISPKEEISNTDSNNDVEVSFSITLPKKPKPEGLTKSESLKNSTTLEQNTDSKSETERKSSEGSLFLKKYQVIKTKDNDVSETTEVRTEKNTTVPNGVSHEDNVKVSNGDAKSKLINQSTKKDEVNSKTSETDGEKKGTVKKKIIRKVSSKSKTDLGSSLDTNDTKTSTEKKKVTKKVKDKTADDDGTKATTVTKKKSMLQSIGQKLEKFASNKSSSPEKSTDSSAASATKKSSTKLNRMQREQSVPVNVEPTTESNLIKRAVTLTDVAALENQTPQQSKTTVSKVLGLFKKFEPKERSKPIVEKSLNEKLDDHTENTSKIESTAEFTLDLDKDKPRRPTSLLLNGLGRKTKYDRTSSDSVSAVSADNDEQSVSKKDNESKSIRNSLKLDFSRLPRVNKKIVPTNPVIEPQIMNVSSVDTETEKKDIPEKNIALLDSSTNIENADSQSRSRSRSRSTISNSELKSDLSADARLADKNPLSPSDNTTLHLRNHDSVTPEKEDIVDRIRRKSFYSRFNEKKQRRKSSLVGPGAAEYDPLARIHSQPTETKYDVSPTSPLTYDLSPISPGLSVSSDLSPSTERYRSLLTDLPVNTRSNLRFENYGLNDKIDTYRSLDRNDFRKYPGSRSYLDYEQPTYGTSRYSRTKSLLENSEAAEDNNSLGNSLRDPHKYNRTISMYSPGNYATYRPKRTTRNSAIILKESEKEPSPENILDKIRQRKLTISVTRKPDPEKEPLPRSNIPSKGEGDGAECSEKVD
ncbi:nuak family kinase 1 isoform X2 [Anticarsia gemmatalis]|uniref:nuak family kinase 1 isoform X2 n=1 Tax=Anticarsia gemmatalis TaxID=129554 RepID=UPI003F768A9C